MLGKPSSMSARGCPRLAGALLACGLLAGWPAGSAEGAGTPFGHRFAVIDSPFSAKIVRVAAGDGTSARLPRPRPDPVALVRTRRLADFHGFEPDYALKAALDAFVEKRY